MENNNHSKNANLGIVLTSGESVVFEIKKHPVGGLFILLAGVSITFAILLASFLIFIFLRSGSDNNADSIAPIVLAIGMFISIFVVIATLINFYLYNQNRLIITTDKIAQINYITLFDRKVIQLSIDRLQDVTVSQVGVFSRLFKYGTVIIDTAGEQEDCIFTYAPQPYELSRSIMDQHEKSISKKTII